MNELEQPEGGQRRLKGVSIGVFKRTSMEDCMRSKLITACLTLAALFVLCLSSVGRAAQTAEMARHEPHMSAAFGHLRQARAELEKAAPNKGGHRDRAIQLVDQAMQQVEAGEAYYQQTH